MTFPQISDDPGQVFARFGVLSQPAFVLISGDGKVETLLGAVDEARIESMLGKLISG